MAVVSRQIYDPDERVLMVAWIEEEAVTETGPDEGEHEHGHGPPPMDPDSRQGGSTRRETPNPSSKSPSAGWHGLGGGKKGG